MAHSRPPFPVKANDPKDPNSHLPIDPYTQRPIHHTHQYMRPIKHFSKHVKPGKEESDYDQEKRMQQRYRHKMRDWRQSQEMKDKINKVVSKDEDAKIDWDQNELNEKLKDLKSGTGLDQFDPFNPSRIRSRKKKAKKKWEADGVDMKMTGEEYAKKLSAEQREWGPISLYFPADKGEQWSSYFDLCQSLPV